MADITGKNVMVDTVRSAVPFLKLYLDFPIRYNILYAFLFSGFCSLLAVFIYSLSLYVKKYVIVLFLPLLILTQLQEQADMAFEEMFDYYVNLNMKDYVFIGYYFGQSVLYITILCLVFLGISILLIWKKSKGDQLG